MIDIIEAMLVVLFWTFLHANSVIEIGVLTGIGWFVLFLVYQYGSYL